MACNCGGNCNAIARRQAPRGYPAIVPGGLYDLTPGGSCPSWAQQLADNQGLRLVAYVVGGPAYDLPLAYCASGDMNANMRKAFMDGALYYGAWGTVMGLAGLVPTPATPILLVMGPLCLAVAAVLKSMADGKPPDLSSLASAAAPALAAVGGDPTGGKAADVAGAAGALGDFAMANGLVPPLPSFTPSPSSRTARDAKKNALKEAKAKAKTAAILNAKTASKAKLDACKARGGVFDPRSPDGCSVSGGGGSKKTGKAGGGGKALVGAGIALALAKAFL